MKKIILNTALFSLLICIAFLLIRKTKDEPENDYLYAILDKHKRLEETPSPKIILVGGSNLAFGIDSKQLENEFKIPVINMGLHANLGYSFMLSHLESMCQPNDIAVISMEYFLDDGNPLFKRELAELLDMTDELINTNPIELVLTNKEEVQNDVKKKLKKIFPRRKGVGTIYRRDGFNTNGDFVAHLNLPRKTNFKDFTKYEYTYWKGIERLNETASLLEKKKASCFFVYPSYLNKAYLMNKESLQKLEKDLTQHLNMEIVGEVNSFVFADSLFFDSTYHLGAEGRDQRTKYLIMLLKESQEFLYSLLIMRK